MLFHIKHALVAHQTDLFLTTSGIKTLKAANLSQHDEETKRGNISNSRKLHHITVKEKLLTSFQDTQFTW